jgi:hypothetical protein
MAQLETSARDRPLLHVVRDLPFEAPDVTDVYPVLGGGWRATCECGATRAAANSTDGWEWVLSHPCN